MSKYRHKHLYIGNPVYGYSLALNFKLNVLEETLDEIIST